MRLKLTSACLGVLMSGCASYQPTGALVTMVTMPVSGNDVQYSKEGRASCWSFFSLVATGNCSVEKAAKSGGVTKIKMVSRETNNFLGIVGKYTTIVQGD
ncbi:TRL-like family protein [Helicobacter pylori]|uniref:TRL-like family protein n=1 Tax=Helicobacter pylori TaxID=210 RepID=UPI000BBB1EC3|nr:TRL-like family protein [Helicobacter pylori]UOR64013.1 TRL-like family protein [Helicobacter pylori]WQS91261.1 TRL-like family protein [Helicobacter pylori]WRB74941.1 TRL-like family protein [Helicobacter pylori]WRD72246.1 TRL-like family protein [Helicobacter pylori]WRD91686.1 TRL-like family protein [Helicobacter pylori]